MTIPGQLGKYQLITRLGGGNFGEVFLAHDRALASNTAIKIIEVTNTTDIPSLLKEAQILDKCRHKHIVEINEANVFTNQPDHFLVYDLEYLPEGSIETELSNRWMSFKESTTRISQVLSGLQHAHDLGFLHRDIKPGNILISGQSSKLSDFGLATLNSLCTPGMACYHPHCPPEFYPSHTPSASGDIFAMGMTYFRMVNNYSNWRPLLSAISDLTSAVEKGRVIHLVGHQSYVPSKLRRIVNRACHSDPTRRFQKAIDFKNELDALRFEIDWTRNSIGHWTGRSQTDEYALDVVSHGKTYNLEYRKNGRRITANCATHPTAQSAFDSIHKIVSETSLA
jgi:serine/threonine-protein kinase